MIEEGASLFFWLVLSWKQKQKLRKLSVTNRPGPVGLHMTEAIVQPSGASLEATIRLPASLTDSRLASWAAYSGERLAPWAVCCQLWLKVLFFSVAAHSSFRYSVSQCLLPIFNWLN